jgi:hypothetical protein
LNPDVAETCQFCSAPMPSAWDESSLASDEDSQVTQGENAADQSLEPASGINETASHAVPEWLQGLREVFSDIQEFDTSAELTDFSAGEILPDRDIPDWLKNVLPETSEQETILPGAESDVVEVAPELSNLLSSLSGNEDPGSEQQAEEAPHAAVAPQAEKGPALESDEIPIAPNVADEVLEETISPIVQAEETLLQIPDEVEPVGDQAELDSQPAGHPPAAEQPEAHSESVIFENEEWIVPGKDTTDSPGEGFFWPKSTPEITERLDNEFDRPGEWKDLSSFVFDTPEPPKASEPVAEAYEDLNLDWLSGETASAEEKNQKETFPDDFSWLDEIDADSIHKLKDTEAETNHPFGKRAPAENPDGARGELPEWAFLPISSKEDEAGAGSSLADQEELSASIEFLSDKEAFSEEDSSTQGEDTAKEEIPSAELPGWLKAMRPVGALNLEGDFGKDWVERAEKSGPLAGLIGAIPAEPVVVHSTKPPVYSLKLQVTDSHQTHAQLLAQLIASEGEPKLIPEAPLPRGHRWQRILIALILFGAAALTSLVNIPIPNSPAIGAEVFIASQLVEGLPDGAPVLLAVDYSPGYTGELEPGLTLVLEQLIAQGHYPVFISTNPAGPILTEHLVAKLKAAGRSTGSFEYTNLGFIAGGPSGLAAFASDPRSSMPFNSQAEPAWSIQALRDIRTVADFSILVIASENPDSARSWIEQVQPLLGNTPLMMVASAQLEPIIRPYYDAPSRQVDGLVSGFSGAVEYGLLAGRTSTDFHMWSPFAISLSVSVVLIIFVASFNIISNWIARKRIAARNEVKV